MSKKEKINYNYDGVENPDIIILRRMLYDDPTELIREVGKEELRRIFWEFWFLMDKRNLNFWKFILEIGDEEFDRKTEGSIRRAIKVWDY